MKDQYNESKRKLKVLHSNDKYQGKLYEMSFRDRHLKIFEMVVMLIGNSCENEVSKLGNIIISKDPEQESDEEGTHPKYYIWDFQCK